MCVARDRLFVQTDGRMDGLYFLPRVGKFGGVISKFLYIGGYIATTWINQRGKVMEIKAPLRRISFKYQLGRLREHERTVLGSLSLLGLVILDGVHITKCLFPIYIYIYIRK
jgi:hypothetical protein